MKVLHLNSEKSWRGGEQQMAYLAELLQRKGIHNTIAIPAKNSKVTSFTHKIKASLLHLPFGGLQVLASLKLFFWLKKNKIDLIHTHTAKAHTVAVWANMLGANTPIVVSKRTDFPVKTKYKFEHPSIKAIVCVSKKIADITKTNLSSIKQKVVTTIYSGIDLARFETKQIDLKSEHHTPQEKILIGNCSAIADHKDYFTFLDTAKILIQSQPDKFHFIIIGDGPMSEEIKTYCHKLHLDKHVTFTGFIEDLNQKLKSLDLFLMTSKTEGLGTSLLDTMICKVPIISTPAGGIPEIVIHEKTGLLGKIKDPKSLAKNIERLIADPDLKETLIENAYQNATQNFSKENTANKTIKLYQQILGQD